MRIYPLASQSTHTNTHTPTHTPTHTHQHTLAQSTGIHAHRKVLIGCCPALHDAIYWLRVQYPVARDNIACTVLEWERERERGTHRQTKREACVCCLCRRVLDVGTKRFWPFAVWWHSASQRAMNSRHAQWHIVPSHATNPHATWRSTKTDRATWHGLDSATQLQSRRAWPVETVATKGLKSAHKKSAAREMCCCCCCLVRAREREREFDRRWKDVLGAGSFTSVVVIVVTGN